MEGMEERPQSAVDLQVEAWLADLGERVAGGSGDPDVEHEICERLTLISERLGVEDEDLPTAVLNAATAINRMGRTQWWDEQEPTRAVVHLGHQMLGKIRLGGSIAQRGFPQQAVERLRPLLALVENLACDESLWGNLVASGSFREDAFGILDVFAKLRPADDEDYQAEIGALRGFCNHRSR